jgi:hypothetical protein
MRRSADIFERRGPRKQVEGLENEADAAVAYLGKLVVGKIGYAARPEHVLAGTRPVQAAEHVHEGGLAGSGWTHHRGEFAFRDVDADARERPDLVVADPVGLRQVARMDQRRDRGR